MSMITGVLKWDLFVVYIIMCVIFVALCCFSITCMFLCCPAKKENSHRPFSPTTPFPTTGLAATMALRTAGLTTVRPEINGGDKNCVNKRMISVASNGENSLLEVNHNDSTKKRKKFTRFAEQKKSNSIDVPNFLLSTENELPKSNSGNRISSMAIVEPMPSNKFERCSTKRKNMNHHKSNCRRTSTVSVATMTPTQSLKSKRKNFKVCNSPKLKKSPKKNLEKTNSSNMCSVMDSEVNNIMIDERYETSSANINLAENSAQHIHSSSIHSLDNTMKPNMESPSQTVKRHVNASTSATKALTNLDIANKGEKEKNGFTLKPNSIPHSFDNEIMFDIAKSTPVNNGTIDNTIIKTSTQQKLICNELLGEPNDQKSRKCNNQEMVVDVDGNVNMYEYKRGLFVIYMDETYVDLQKIWSKSLNVGLYREKKLGFLKDDLVNFLFLQKTTIYSTLDITGNE